MRSTHPLPPSAQDDYPGLYSGLRRRPPAPAGLQAPSQRALVGDQPATGSLCWVMLIPGRGLGILGAGESVSQTTFSLYLDRGHTYLTSAAARLGSLFVWFLPQRLASLGQLCHRSEDSRSTSPSHAGSREFPSLYDKQLPACFRSYCDPPFLGQKPGMVSFPKRCWVYLVPAGRKLGSSPELGH